MAIAMTKSAFGRRDVKEFSTGDSELVKAHMAYTGTADTPLIDRVLTWTSYYTLVFVTIAAFAPDQAAAAVLTVRAVLS